MTIEKVELGSDTIYLQGGLLHNEGAPAWLHADGTKEYYTNGRLDRKDGPARITSNGEEEYWFDGVYQGKEVNGVFYPWKLNK